MRQSFLPFILVSAGFSLFLLGMAMPLLEWQISKIGTDFPPIYEVHVHSSPWTARFGESFDEDSYLYRNISVLKDRQECFNEDINLVVRRSQKDEAIEQRWLNMSNNISWLPGWSLIESGLAILYIWWFVIWYKHQSVWQAIGLTILAVFIFLNLIPRLTGPLFPHTFLGAVDCDHGTITFSATLLKTHYGTPIVLFMGILAELGALVIMIREITGALIETKKFLNLQKNF